MLEKSVSKICFILGSFFDTKYSYVFSCASLFQWTASGLSRYFFQYFECLRLILYESNLRIFMYIMPFGQI